MHPPNTGSFSTLMLPQCPYGSDAPLDPVKELRATPQHQEHEGDEDNDLRIDGEQGGCFQKEPAHGIKTVG